MSTCWMETIRAGDIDVVLKTQHPGYLPHYSPYDMMMTFEPVLHELCTRETYNADNC